MIAPKACVGKGLAVREISTCGSLPRSRIR
jgi:hypothetical protein